jgi:hypothetical protein
VTAPQSGPPAISPIAEFINAALAPPQGNGSDLGFVTATVQSWDEISGTNTVVLAGGVVISNLKSIQPGIGVQYQPGDVVGLKRVGNSYLVEGRITTPGAGSGNQIRSARVATLVNTGAQAFGDLPGSFGPQLTNVYIGSSRRCLVIHSAELTVSQSGGFQGIQVTGASSIAVETGITDVYTDWFGGAGLGIVLDQSVTASTLVTAANGLNQGFNTFTAKYKVTLNGTGTGAQFNNRVLTVIPF